MNIEQIKQKMAEIDSAFIKNRELIKALQMKGKEVYEENVRLQGEHRLLKTMLKDLEPKVEEKPPETATDESKEAK